MTPPSTARCPVARTRPSPATTGLSRRKGRFHAGIVSAAMGVAGDVAERLQFSEDRDIGRRAKGLFEFVEGGNLGTHEQRAQFVGAVREGSHNVIVPT